MWPPRPPPEQLSTELEELIVPASDSVPSAEVKDTVPPVAVALMVKVPAGFVPVEVMVVTPPLTEVEPTPERLIAP